MDFGLVGLDAFVVGPTSSSEHPQVLEGKPKFNNNNNNHKNNGSNNNNGSGSVKQERSDPFEDDVGTTTRSSKLAKRADDLSLLRSDNNNNSNNAAQPKQQMLSFSCNNNDKIPEVSFITAKDVGFISEKNGLSFYQQTPSSAAPAYSRTPAGFGTGNLNGGMHGSFTGIRGPFTPAQWIELEHQAMIYKYLTANMPVPSQLLIPIRKAIHSSGFPGFSVGSYPIHSYGWGPFHLGYSGSTDPEPGRCRRTDGKKWRCSRDAVPDQKYCERHINRGRHRSRKPVEGHNGQAASGPNAKVVPTMSPPVSSLVSPGVGVSSSVAIAQHQIKGLQPTVSTNTIAKSLHDQQGLSVMPSTPNLKPKDSPYSITRQHTQQDESVQSEFGVVSSDQLLNPSQKSSYLGCKSYNSLLEFNSQQTEDQYQLKHFMDNWSKDQSNPSAALGHKDLKSDWTQLSMSIPMSDYSICSSSPHQEKASTSPWRLSHEFDPSKMGLGVGTVVSETGNKQNAWLPIAWGNATGGPLGEVLMNNANNALYKGGGWDGSPQLGSSPTGVLQKSTFVSLSNSSSGGSPRGENKRTLEGPSLCDDLLGAAAHASSTSIPSV